VADQVDVTAAASCSLVAVEVRAPGRQLAVLADPVALAAALGLGDTEAADAVTLCQSLVDYSNAVVGCLGATTASSPRQQGAETLAEPWVIADGRKIALREACTLLAGLPVGAGRTVCAGSRPVEVDDLFAVDLATVADDATARRGSLGQAVVAASLHRLTTGTDQVGQLSALLRRPVRCTSTEPVAARLGALTTPGARPDAVVVDVGAGTIDIISPDAEVVAAGAGDLLTSAVAHTLGVSLAAAEWVKRGPCLRVEGAQRFEAEDGSRGFLDRPAPASATGMLAVTGPAGLLSFDRNRSPAEWRAIRLRLKQAVFAVNLRRALAGQQAGPGQILIVGGAAADEELLGVLLRSLPLGAAVGRGNVGGTLSGPPAGHRYAAAVGLALAAGSP
jgi:Diol dehydratase reactivase ATPase-like domain